MNGIGAQLEGREFTIAKAESDKMQVFGWASVAVSKDGQRLSDHEGDEIDPEELEKAAYEYVLNFRDAGERHDPDKRQKGKMIESVVFTKEKQEAMGLPEASLPEGWWIGFQITDEETWRKIKSGEFKMFSVEGQGERWALDEEASPAGRQRKEMSPAGRQNGGASLIGRHGVAKSFAEIMKYEHEGRRVNGVGVLVQNEKGELLAGTRIGGKHDGQIGGAGGHIEAGETPSEAAAREAREEFGIECKDLEELGYQDGGSAYGQSCIFLCREWNGEPEADEEEMADARWYAPSELQQLQLFKPFADSLQLLPEMSLGKRHGVAKSFGEIVKFNPFHDSNGRFASSKGFTTYSANPKTKAGAMAIARSAQAGHGSTLNVHRESKGENITQNYNWLNGGAGAKALSAQGKLASQKKPRNYDRLGFADQDDAAHHQLYNGRGYYNQQNLDSAAKQACKQYTDPYTEPGSLYNFSQNMNQAVLDGTINKPKNARYKQVYDEINNNMHNLGYNIECTRYDHGDALDKMLADVGITGGHSGMSIAQISKALVGKEYTDDRILSTSGNNFKNVSAQEKSTFDTREIKFTIEADADTKVLMPGVGAGGDFGELLFGSSGKNGANKFEIAEVRYSGAKARKKGMPKSHLTERQIEIVIKASAR